MFGIRLPCVLTAAFIDQALKASEGIAGLSAAMRGLIAARTAVMTAVAAIDADIRRMTTASEACRRLMAIPGVGQLTALAFVTAIDDPSRIRRSRDVGAYLGLVPKRYQSGEVDYVGGISKCGDRRVRTLLYEAANVMLASSSSRTGPSPSPGDQACARRASLWRVASPSSCTPCCGTERRSSRRRPTDRPLRQETASSSRKERRPREGADDGVDFCSQRHHRPTAFSTLPPLSQLTPSSASERAENAGIPKASITGRAPPP